MARWQHPSVRTSSHDPELGRDRAKDRCSDREELRERERDRERDGGWLLIPKPTPNLQMFLKCL